jgi:hypothetical protein
MHLECDLPNIYLKASNIFLQTVDRIKHMLSIHQTMKIIAEKGASVAEMPGCACFW